MDCSSETLFRASIERQETQPLPAVRLVYVRGDGLLTLRQVREGCRLNVVQLAQVARIRPIVVDWCERGRMVRADETAQILAALARCLTEKPARTTFGL